MLTVCHPVGAAAKRCSQANPALGACADSLLLAVGDDLPEADASGLLLPPHPTVARARATSPSAVDLEVTVPVTGATVVVAISVARVGALRDSG